MLKVDNMFIPPVFTTSFCVIIEAELKRDDKGPGQIGGCGSRKVKLVLLWRPGPVLYKQSRG